MLRVVCGGYEAYKQQLLEQRHIKRRDHKELPLKTHSQTHKQNNCQIMFHIIYVEDFRDLELQYFPELREFLFLTIYMSN